MTYRLFLQKRVARRTLLRHAAIAALLFSFSLSAGCMTNHAIGNHPEWRKLVGMPEDFGLEAKRVEFPSRDGLTLTGWWISAPRRDSSNESSDHSNGSTGTFVLAHGQGGNRSHMLKRAAFLTRHGFHVLAIDLRSHGESCGNYMTPGYMERLDVLGAIDHVRQRVDTGRLFLLGYSYGAVAVLHAASESSEPDGVIADAAFISQNAVMHALADYVMRDPQASWGNKVGISFVKWPFVLLLARWEFYLRTGVDLNPRKADAIRAVRRIERTPILFLAGESDPISPARNIRRMYDECSSPLKEIAVLADATHNTYTDQTQDEYEAAVLAFVHLVSEPSGSRQDAR